MSHVKIINGDCLQVLPTLADASVDSIVTDPPYLLEFMGKSWDSPTDAMGLSTFDAWFAGFVAGEGCFRIQKFKDGAYYACAFQIHLRADDAPILVAIQKRLGGRIVFGDERVNKQGVRSAPDVRWIIDTRDGCKRIATIFDRVPLFAKKAKDYELWRRGLDLWINTPRGNRWHGARDVSEMSVLHRQLQDVKRFITGVDLDFDPFMQPAQAFHYRWALEALRVLKPGGHIVAFGGTRTQHRLVCALEDAGFEIRETLLWLYAQGFPKALDVSKAIDKAAGATRRISGVKAGHEDFVGRTDAHSAGARREGWDRPWKADPEAVARYHMATESATDAARQWQGWGSALKPAVEMVCLARKPLIGTIAENVLAHGTGALNIDACRVPFVNKVDEDESKGKNQHSDFGSGVRSNEIFGRDKRNRTNHNPPGRWPANVTHDGSDEVLAAFEAFEGGKRETWNPARRSGMGYGSSAKGQELAEKHTMIPADGNAARFFFSAKVSSKERAGSDHPTMKPVALMEWLIKLITPPGGLVLDPFSGSGSTGVACARLHFPCILIEQSDKDCDFAANRIRQEDRLTTTVEQKTHRRKLVEPTKRK